MLRKLRITLATVMMTLITLLFLDFTGTLHHYLGWVAKVQLLPALLALNVAVVVVLAALTLIFGRIYCSVICPLGIMQDTVASLRHKKNRYCYSPELKWLRYGILTVFIVAMVAGVGSMVALLAPYSSYGRIVQNLFQPVYIWGNNLLAHIAEHYESYAFYSEDVWIRSLPTFIIASISFIVISIMAWQGGRTYCNTICPVGTLLSLPARFSLLKIKFDETKCKKCGKCSRNCKAACIDHKTMTVDYSRCVVCGNCLQQCEFDSLHYTLPKKVVKTDVKTTPKEHANEGRRSFLIGAALVTTGTAMAQAQHSVDGGLAVIEDKLQPERLTPVTPPGSLSAQNMAHRCTGCQLCVSKCPNHVLRPSENLMTLMQPTMSYERGYCRPECNLCSQVCPTGAIRPISLSDKSATQIGRAVWVKQNCLPVADGVSCGNCERHCPTGAIEMIPLDDNDDTSPWVPSVNTAICIGCGACEHVCPARPFSAIYVEGNEVHHEV